MKIKVYDSITEVDEMEWNSIVGRDRIICTHKYLEAIEKSNINDCKYYYPVVYDEAGRIIAHTCVYSISNELDLFAKGIVKKIITSVRRVWNNFLIIKSLECGTPIAPGNTLSFRDGLEKKEVLKAITSAIERLAKEKGIKTIVIRDFYDEELVFFNHLAKLNYHKVNILPNTVLEVPWETFDEYIQDLKSHYRCKIKKNMELAGNKGLTTEVIDKFDFLSSHLHFLWSNVYERAKDYQREILTEKFFSNIDKCLSDKTKVILLKVDSEIRGFGLVLLDEDTLRYMYTGLNYDFNKEYCLYLNSLYNVIKLAIAEGKKKVDMGITAYFPKTDVGAKIVNLNVYIKHLNFLINPFLAFVYKKMTPTVKPTPKHIFKK